MAETLDTQLRLDLYRQLVRVQKLNDFGLDCLRRGAISLFWHSGAGHEAIGVGAVSALTEEDMLYYNYRGHGVQQVVPKGVEPRKIFAEHAGKTTGACKSLSGFHVVAPEKGIFGWTGLLGAQFGITLGYGRAALMNGRGQVAVCMFGDGSANKGQFHESLNMSALWKLPIIWICENNGYAVYVPLDKHLSSPSGTYLPMAESYGIPAVAVDGSDVEAVYLATAAAAERARRGDGPTYIECSAFRRDPHVAGMPNLRSYTPRGPEELAEWDRFDPVARYERLLLADGTLTPAQRDEVYAAADAEIFDVRRFMEESPQPDPASFPVYEIVYA